MMKWRKNKREKWRRRCVRTSTAASPKLGRGSFHGRRKIPFLSAFVVAFGSVMKVRKNVHSEDFKVVCRIVITNNNSNN